MTLLAKYDRKLNLLGLSCPLPALKTQLALQNLRQGEILWVIASDAQSIHDIPAVVAQRGDIIQSAQQISGEYHFFIEKS
jgi:tRNA 2-thiouridine synthesizing protein A